MLYLGHKMSAQEAMRHGLISEVYNHESLEEVWNRLNKISELSAEVSFPSLSSLTYKIRNSRASIIDNSISFSRYWQLRDWSASGTRRLYCTLMRKRWRNWKNDANLPRYLRDFSSSFRGKVSSRISKKKKKKTGLSTLYSTLNL